MKNKEPEKENPGFVSRVLNLENECRATEFSEAVSKILIGCFCILCFLHIGGLIVFERRVRMKLITSIWLKSYIAGLGMLMAINIILLWRQPQANMQKLKFKVPLMPWVPVLSIYMNTYLMSKLDKATWMRFLVWLVIGLIVYLWYGLSHSKQGKINNESEQIERRTELSKR